MQTPAEPVEITADLRAKGFLVEEDYNLLDSVFEYDGLKVKVKLYHEVHPLPIACPTGVNVVSYVDVIRAWASIVGDDGKALALVSGDPAVFGFGDHITVQHETETDLKKEVYNLQCEVIKKAVRAWRHHLTIQDMPLGRNITRVVGTGHLRKFFPTPEEERSRPEPQPIAGVPDTVSPTKEELRAPPSPAP